MRRLPPAPAAPIVPTINPRPGFFDMPGSSQTPLQLVDHRRGTASREMQQHQRVKPQIGDFANQVRPVPILGRHEHLGRLFGDFLQLRIQPFVVERGHIGLRG